MRATTTGYQGQDFEDAISVLGGWLSKNRNVRTVWHDGTAVNADVHKGIVRLPRALCSSGLTEEMVMRGRGCAYHEFGHIAETKLSKSEHPKGALFNILNALEDVRMEAVLSNQYPGCRSVFDWMIDDSNKQIAKRILEGRIQGQEPNPLWEALSGMMFMTASRIPSWTIQDKSQMYIDAAYDEFVKVRNCKTTRDCLKLAERIYEILKDALKDWKDDQQQDGEGEQGEGEQDEQQKGQKGQQDENESDPMSDIDDEQDEQSGGKSDDSDESDESEDEQDGEGSEDDSDEKDDGSESEAKAGDGEDGEDKESKADADDEAESKSGGDDSEDNSEGSDKDDSSKTDGDETDSEGDDSEDKNEGSSEDSDEGENESDKDADEDDGPTDEELAEELDEDSEGKSAKEIQNEELANDLEGLDPRDAAYTACRDRDQHLVPDVNDADRRGYQRQRDGIAASVTAMTRSMEQALRSMARSRKNPYLRHGKIDRRRLTQIAKGLSKEVFYKTRDGETLEAAVEIIIDESGSMGGGQCKSVRLLAIAVGEALNQIGIPFEIMGTTTEFYGGNSRMPEQNGFTRSNPLVYSHYKTFSEQWIQVRERIVHTGSHKHNVDGEAVEYAAFRLMQRDESRKVILSLSDGSPCAGHNNDGLMAENLIRVCERVRQNGIEVYGFGIATSEPEQYYGKDWFVYLDDVKSMGVEFTKRFVSILTGGRFRV